MIARCSGEARCCRARLRPASTAHSGSPLFTAPVRGLSTAALASRRCTRFAKSRPDFQQTPERPSKESTSPPESTACRAGLSEEDHLYLISHGSNGHVAREPWVAGAFVDQAGDVQVPPAQPTASSTPAGVLLARNRLAARCATRWFGMSTCDVTKRPAQASGRPHPLSHRVITMMVLSARVPLDHARTRDEERSAPWLLPPVSIFAEATQERGRLLIQDHLCLLLAGAEGWTCVSNDRAVRAACSIEVWASR
jgi:hypothetical protein